jgi:hypothetical protein
MTKNEKDVMMSSCLVGQVLKLQAQCSENEKVGYGYNGMPEIVKKTKSEILIGKLLRGLK